MKHALVAMIAVAIIMIALGLTLPACTPQQLSCARQDIVHMNADCQEEPAQWPQ